MALVFFDWDGTICRGEVAEQGCIRLNKMLGNPVPEEIMIYGHKDNSHFKEIKKALQNYTGVSNAGELTKMMTNIFEINYLSVIKEKGRESIYSGMEEILASLKSKGNKIAIISTSTAGIVNNSVNIMGLAFDAIYANDSYMSSSKRELFLKASKELGEPAVMIGDREEDMLSAAGFAAKKIFCEWGHGVLNKAVPDYIIKNQEELKQALIGLKLL